MKNFKALGILALLAVLILAVVLIINNNAKTVTPPTTDIPTKVEDDKIEENIKTEDVIKVTEDDPKTKDETPEIPNTPPLEIVPEIAHNVAVVATVYPRNSIEATNSCDAIMPSIGIKKFEGSTTNICDISNEQLQQISGDYKGSDFCECINQFCGTSNQTNKFVECLKQRERIVESSTSI